MKIVQRDIVSSSINENWMRVEIMHSVARTYYENTRDTDFRNRMISGESPFPFDITAHSEMSRESSIVGMVIAWSVVVLECMANHAIAKSTDNRLLSIMAIEYPSQITDKLRVSGSAKSELAKKLIILNNSTDNSMVPTELADRLSEYRNLIVHDKPYRLVDYGDGDISIDYYASRKGNNDAILRYDDLSEFFSNCDTIAAFIKGSIEYDVFGNSRIEFKKLING